MNFKIKKLVALILALSMIMLVGAGCQSSGGAEVSTPADSSTSATDSDSGIINIEYWHAMSGGRGEETDTFVQRFNEGVGKEKGINVTSVYQGNEIMSKTKMASQESGGKNMPDVTQTVGHDIPVILQMENVVRAEGLITAEASAIKKEDFPESMLRAFTYQDELIGVPMNNSGILLYYNTDMLAEVGLEGPPKTIAELADYAEKLTVKEGESVSRYGLNATISRYQLVNFVTSQSPDSFFGDNEGGRTAPMTKLTVGEDGTLKKFLTEWTKVAALDGYKFIEDNAAEEFVTGVSAMTIMSSSKLGTVEGLGGDSFNFEVAYLPKVNEADTSGASVGGSSLIVFNNGSDEKQAAAWTFVEYATSAENQALWSQATGYMPTNVGALDLLKDFYAENPKHYVAYQQMLDSSPNSQEPFDLSFSQINTTIIDVMERFCNGEIDVDQAEAEIIERCNTAVAEYNLANN